MAALLLPTSTYQNRPNPKIFTNHFLYSPFQLHRPFQPRRTLLRCHAASPEPPPPPPPPPSPLKDLTQLGARLSRIQNGVQIFFAVLVWMTLFFWASAWDGRNNGRPNKGSQSRR